MHFSYSIIIVNFVQSEYVCYCCLTCSMSCCLLSVFVIGFISFHFSCRLLAHSQVIICIVSLCHMALYSAIVNSSMQEAAQCMGVDAAHDVTIAAKHHTARAFFRRRMSAPSLKQHRHRHKSLHTSKHSRLLRPRRCSAGNLESSVSYVLCCTVMDLLVAGCS